MYEKQVKRTTKESLISGAVGLVLAMIVISVLVEPAMYPFTIGIFILLAIAVLISVGGLVASGRSASARPEMAPDDVADLIERFLGGSVGEWEWSNFTDYSHKDDRVERARQDAVRISEEFPAQGQWCSDEGVRALLRLAASLRDLNEGGAA